MDKSSGSGPRMNPQEARAAMARLYEDVCDGLEKQLSAVDCLELSEGEYSLGAEDLAELASIMVRRGYSAQVFRFSKAMDRSVLVLGNMGPPKQQVF